MSPVRLEPAASRSRVKHSTTEPLRSLWWPDDWSPSGIRIEILTFFILMDFPRHVNRISMESSILYFKRPQGDISKLYCSSVSGEFSVYLSNRPGPDEMPPFVAFHLGLHCLPKYLFTDVQNEKG